MTILFKAPKGTSDFLFPESASLEQLQCLASEIFSVCGYRPVATPLLENSELFRRGIGEGTDIVNKEMYTFEDQGGESLALRPEGTAPVVRAYLENSMYARGLPQKLYYFGPMFRRERPQAGRYRQFHQLGCEAIGTHDAFVDAEVISISERIFETVGLSEYALLLNSVGCSDCRPSYIRMLVAHLEEISQELCADCQRRSRTNPLRVFDCKNESCIRALAGAPLISDQLCPECREHFDEVKSHLRRFGIDYELDSRLVRGLDYYTKTTFEFKFPGLGAQDTVSAGGRYDSLVSQLGGEETPGVGFSLGVERLLLAISAAGISPFRDRRLEIFVVGAPGADRNRLIDILLAVRNAGFSADTDYLGRGMKAQMKQASRLEARLALIIGKDELERGMVIFRDLDSSSQWEVPLAGMVAAINDFLEEVS